MARKIANIRICDHCTKEQVDDGQPRFGGSVFSGWYEVKRVDGSTSLQALNSQRDFDFCSIYCMKAYKFTS